MSLPDAPARVTPAIDTILVSLRSPSFETRPPVFVGEDLIPASVRMACSAWERRQFPGHEIRIRVLRDVVVAEEGLVFDREGRLIEFSVRQHEPDLVARAQEAVRRVLEGEPTPGDDTPLILAKKRGAGNYGHWMIEILPMVHLVLQRLPDKRIGVLVHDVADRQLGLIMQESLRRMGVEDNRVRVSGVDPVIVRELIMVEGLTEHGTYMSPLVCECHDRLAHGIAGNGIERVFLSRGAGMGRQFQDDGPIAQIAEDLGYTVLSPAALDLDGQISLMRSARLVAGVMGAAMTNLVYARPGTRATLFAPAGMPDTFFWFIANLKQIDYREVRCAQPGDGAGWDRPLDIGLDSFRGLLEQDVALIG